MYLSEIATSILDRYVWRFHWRKLLIHMYRHCHSRLFIFLRLKERQINIGLIDLRPGETTCYPSGGTFSLPIVPCTLTSCQNCSILSYHTIIQQSQTRNFQFQFIAVFFYIQLFFKLLFFKIGLFVHCQVYWSNSRDGNKSLWSYTLFLGMVLPTEILAENYLNATILCEFFFIFRQQRMYPNLMSQRLCMK